MHPKHVYVIWTNPIFRESMRLILTHPNVQWLGETSKMADALPALASLRPDIVFVELEQETILIDILNALPTGSKKIRLIGISLINNQAVLYQREQTLLVSKGEIINLVLAE